MLKYSTQTPGLAEFELLRQKLQQKYFSYYECTRRIW